MSNKKLDRLIEEFNSRIDSMRGWNGMYDAQRAEAEQWLELVVEVRRLREDMRDLQRGLRS